VSGGLVAWLTGLPGSGKSTLARAAQAELARDGVAACVLDGDEVRAALRPAPGYDETSRADFYATLAGLAALLAAQGLVVLVAATANLRAYRVEARRLAPRFVEVHVACDGATCAARDPKGLYRLARAGQIGSLPGAGAEYEPPVSPELVVDTTIGSIADGALAIVQRLAVGGP
jgi:adenylylsulfate kinase